MDAEGRQCRSTLSNDKQPVVWPDLSEAKGVAAVRSAARTCSNLRCNFRFSLPAPVAQLDRVAASEAVGHRFESCRVHHVFP